MESFLKKLSLHIFEHYREKTGDICVVLPNRRAGLFLKKYLAGHIDRPVWAPGIFSIDDFFIQLSGLRQIDPVGILFVFYDVYQFIEKEKAQPFEEFLSWANVLLQDFNTIDLHLTNPRILFSYLTEAKAIEKWNLGERPLTKFEKEYLRFYNSLFQYYSELKKVLLERKEAYQGLIYRELEENISKVAGTLKWEKIIFAGFNALTVVEEKIIDFFRKSGIADLLWDADEYYLIDKSQEAGLFLREYFKKFKKGEIKWIGKDFLGKKEIRIFGIPKNVGQARLAGQILYDWSKKDTKFENTALVMCDETLFLPVLNSLPSAINDFNVTMGYPLKNTNLFQLFSFVFSLYENAGRFGKLEKSGKKGFYYPDILKILRHNYVQLFFVPDELVEEINNSNRVFYTSEQIIDMVRFKIEKMPDIVEILFSGTTPPPLQVVEKFEKIITVLRDHFIEKNSGKNGKHIIDLEYLYHFAKIIARLKSFISNNNYVKTIKTLRRIFNSIIRYLKVPFYGEPLRGLQIMGMLETRNLDFDRLILLSANEDILPSSGIGNSFIPYDIRKEFGLPTIKEKNAVFAYHFYRLLQKACDVNIIFSTEADKFGGCEKSRFISQLQYELPLYNPEIKISEETINMPPPVTVSEKTIVIKKSPAICDKLLKKAESGFSPSILNIYRRCPLQFYFQGIAGLDETEDVEENIDFRTMGNIVHETLENLYMPYIGTKLKAEYFGEMQKNMDSEIRISFNNKYRDGAFNYGKNLLIFEVVRIFVKRFLNIETEFIKGADEKGDEIIIRELEGKYNTFLKIANGENEIRIKLKGIIDRVDEYAGRTRIIDYKTGNVDASKELRFSDMDDLMSNHNLDKAFQLLMYSWLYWKNKQDANPLYTAGIISFRRLSEKLMEVKHKTLENKQGKPGVDLNILKNFEFILIELLTEIFDKSVPFRQTDNIEICGRCIFSGICNR